MTQFMVERTFPTPLTQQDLDDVSRRMEPCLAMHRVRYVRSFWSLDRRRMICHYEAPDAESLREVQRESGALFDAIWPTEIIGEGRGP